MQLVHRDTPRDQEVLKLLLEGAENAEIAKLLGITSRAVKTHLGAMYRHRHITSGIKRVHLVMLAMDDDLDIASGTAVRFTPREKAILELVVLGWKNREIADKLGTSEHAVKNHMRLIYDKLGLDHRVELVLWYVAHFGKPKTGVE